MQEGSPIFVTKKLTMFRPSCNKELTEYFSGSEKLSRTAAGVIGAPLMVTRTSSFWRRRTLPEPA